MNIRVLDLGVALSGGLMLLMGVTAQAGEGRPVEFTVYSQIIEYGMTEGGAEGRGMTDMTATNNTLHRSIGGPQVATAETSMIITKASKEPGGLETRLFKMIMSFPNPSDTIVIDGISKAAVPDHWMTTNQPSFRAITGGTGRYNGARGQAIYTRLDPVWVRIDLRFFVLKGAKSAPMRQ